MSEYYASRLVKIARYWVGYCEKQSNSNLESFSENCGNKNYTIFAKDLAEAGYYQGSKQGYEWCDVFVDHCFWELCDKNKEIAERITCQTGLYGAGCDWSARYYREQGRLFYENPKIGDQIFFGNYDHTGIVVDVKNGLIYTVEGNSNNKVEEKQYKINDPWVKAFGRPYYDEEPVEPIDDRYHTIEDIPVYAKEAIQFLVDNKYLFGRTENDLDLSEDMTRMFVVNYRAGIYKERT